ncbi:MAG: acyl carrier protein [Ardenticatenia bacterium]|nr:MAG: acyl carrier protein [Ardenticatenia bacterium]
MTAKVIEQFILDDLLLGMRQDPIAPDESLISSGILDSLALLRLITFLEERFGIAIEDHEVMQDNFETIARMEAFVAAKQPA